MITKCNMYLGWDSEIRKGHLGKQYRNLDKGPTLVNHESVLVH